MKRKCETMQTDQGTTLIRNSVLSLFNTLFMVSTGWIISIWVARRLGPTNYGVFTLVLWFSSTFNWLIGMGLTHAVTKFVAESGGKQKEEIIGPIVRFVLAIEIVLSVLVGAVLIFFRTQIANYFFNPSQSVFFLLASIGILPGVVTAVLSSAIQGLQKFEYFTYAGLIITPLSLLCKIIVLFLGYDIAGLLWVMLVFSFINCIFYGFVLKREGIHLFRTQVGLPVDFRKRIARYNYSVMAIMICDKVIWDKSENFFLGRLCTAAQTGFYNLGFNIAQRFTTILPATFWQVLFPAMSNYFGSGNREKMRRLYYLSIRYLAFATFPVGVGGMLLSHQIIFYLYGQEYVEAYRVLRIMFFASIFTSLANPGAAILYGYERQSFIYKLGMIMAVFNIILDIFLIRWYGAVGAAICYASTTVIGSTIGTIYTCRTMHLRFPIASIVRITLSTILMAVVMEMILMRMEGIPGFVLSFVGGSLVYLMSVLVISSTEDEDYSLLSSIKSVLPARSKKIVDGVVAVVTEFKKGVPTDRE